MRTLLLVSAMILAAGSAQACLPQQAATAPQRAPSHDVRLSGSVYLQERPLPGTVLHYPGIMAPLLGPHGGLLAGVPARPQQDQGQG